MVADLLECTERERRRDGEKSEDKRGISEEINVLWQKRPALNKAEIAGLALGPTIPNM